MDLEKYKISLNHSVSFNLFEESPPKGSAHFNKAIFYVPKLNSNVVIMVSNYSDGWQTLINFISDGLKIDAYNFRITMDEGYSDPFNSFSFFKNGTLIRTVYVMKDPKWVFYEQGEIQWFEDETYYSRRLIKDRLNQEVLLNYCTKLNLDFAKKEFWESKQSIVIERFRW